MIEKPLAPMSATERRPDYKMKQDLFFLFFFYKLENPRSTQIFLFIFVTQILSLPMEIQLIVKFKGYGRIGRSSQQ